MADENFEDEIVYNDGEKDKSDVPLMYVGPNIHKLGVERYAIFKGDLPGQYEAACEKIPEIMNLLIPVDDLMKFTRNLLIPGSPERKYCKIVQDKAKNIS